MTPELSRAAADAKERLQLEPDDPRMLELIRAAELGTKLSDLPAWATSPPERGIPRAAADELVGLLTRKSGVLDAHGHLHSPDDGKFIKKLATSLFGGKSKAGGDGDRGTSAVRAPDLIAAGRAEEIAAGAYEAASRFGDEERGFLAGRLLARGGGVGPHGDEALHHIASAQGFEGPAVVLTPEDMNRAVKRGAPRMFRGVRPSRDGTKTAAQIHEQLRSGPAFHGLGFSGNGIYLSSSRSVASEYGTVGRYAMHPDARVIDFRELQQEQKRYLQSLERYSTTWSVFEDPGRYAAARGYDAIRWRRGEEAGRRPGEEDEFIVLNRTALLAEAM